MCSVMCIAIYTRPCNLLSCCIGSTDLVTLWHSAEWKYKKWVAAVRSVTAHHNVKSSCRSQENQTFFAGRPSCGRHHDHIWKGAGLIDLFLANTIISFFLYTICITCVNVCILWTSDDYKGVDFTMPFMNLGVTILYKKPTKKASALFPHPHHSSFITKSTVM